MSTLKIALAGLEPGLQLQLADLVLTVRGDEFSLIAGTPFYPRLAANAEQLLDRVSCAVSAVSAQKTCRCAGSVSPRSTN